MLGHPERACVPAAKDFLGTPKSDQKASPHAYYGFFEIRKGLKSGLVPLIKDFWGSTVGKVTPAWALRKGVCPRCEGFFGHPQKSPKSVCEPC